MEIYRKYNSEEMDKLTKANLKVDDITLKMNENLTNILNNQADLDVRQTRDRRDAALSSSSDSNSEFL